MVESQYRLLKEKFGLDHVMAVIGPSMGGMQTLQWGVSHPDTMDALIAIVPLSKTPPWSLAVMEAAREAIMNDPAWKDGNYDAPPEKGVRLWREIVNLIAARTPEMYSAQFNNGMDVLPWLTEQENALMKVFDAHIPELGLRSARRRLHAWLWRRHRQGSGLDQGKNADPYGDQGSAQSRLRAKGSGEEYCQRQGRDDQPGCGEGACIGRWVQSRGRGVSQSRDRRFFGRGD
jgi:homoserine acetyltransferase